MKQWIALAVVAPALLLGAERETCPFGPFDLRSPREQQASLYHQLSVTAEAVAPSTARRRATDPPAGDTVYPVSINYIDDEIFGQMKRDGVAPAAISSDTEFLRRVTMDLTGQIPDPATVQAFLADTSADKRAKTIDGLLASSAFVDRWTMWFGDLVQNVQVSANSREFPNGRNAYYNWIHDSIQANKPYDQMVRELLGATGDSFASGPPDYWVRQIQPNGPIQDTYDNLAATSGADFLGMPYLCLSCHSGLGHLESVNWYLKGHQRSDFWGDAAFFSRGRAARQFPDPTNKNLFSWLVSDASTGAYSLNTTSGNKSQRCSPCPTTATVSPTFLLTGETPNSGETWRQAYGRMLTAHPQFARAAVNYLWKEMFGLGIVEPTNNMDPSRLDPNNLPAGQTIQPNHPNLLTLLANDFTTSHYDLRALLRTMATSNAYQLSTQYSASAWNESWTPDYARHIPRRLMAEEMLDAITKATNVPVTYPITGGGTTTLAMKLPDTLDVRNNVYGRFLDEFGRGNRDDQARSNDSSIAQALSMMNDNNVVVSRIHRTVANSTVAQALAASTDPNAITDQIYLATLSRYPTAAEKQQAVAYLKSGTLAQKTEDLQWVLLNSLEFMFH
ncbi:MAG TPA: DUF1549 domain-containing protein [Thermoanaerobaculia bacterium]|jgi:hypothetical protein|nr:DUF1549 domain-containing protein [Thermoanaerobaculia bacterium]